MSRKLDETNKNEVKVDLQKREFMGKFGKYAIVGAGMATLMTPNASASGNYGAKGKKGTPDQNSVHTDTINHGGSNDRDINGH